MIQSNVKYLWQDVVCQYWPWAERAALSTPASLQMKPCLPAMHAKAHTWHCQVPQTFDKGIANIAKFLTTCIYINTYYIHICTYNYICVCISKLRMYSARFVGIVEWTLTNRISCWSRGGH